MVPVLEGRTRAGQPRRQAHLSRPAFQGGRRGNLRNSASPPRARHRGRRRLCDLRSVRGSSHSSRHRRVSRLEVVPDLFQTQTHPALDRSERQAEKVGYLRVRVTGKVRQLQYLQLLGREGVEGLPDLVALRVPQRLRKGFARLRAWGRGFDLFLHPAPARLGTDLVYTAVVHYGEQPGPNAAAICTIAASASPDFQKRVLCQVFGSLTFPHHPVGQGEGCAAVTVIQRRKRLGVSRLDQGDQIFVSKNQVLSSPFSHTLILRQYGRSGSAQYLNLRTGNSISEESCWHIVVVPNL